MNWLQFAWDSFCQRWLRKYLIFQKFLVNGFFSPFSFEKGLGFSCSSICFFYFLYFYKFVVGHFKKKRKEKSALLSYKIFRHLHPLLILTNTTRNAIFCIFRYFLTNFILISICQIYTLPAFWFFGTTLKPNTQFSAFPSRKGHMLFWKPRG